jgi:hypothetical protein
LLAVAFVATALLFFVGNESSSPRRPSPGSENSTSRQTEPHARAQASNDSPARRARPQLVLTAGPELTGAKRPVIPPRYGVPSKAEAFTRAISLTLPVAGQWASAMAGDRVSFPYFDGRVLLGTILQIDHQADGQRLIVGALDSGGTFTVGAGPRGFGGRIMPAGEVNVAVIRATKTTQTYLLEKSRQSVLCVAYPKSPGLTGSGVPAPSAIGETITIPQPAFSSRPGTTAVVYLDFDGETVSELDWRLRDDDGDPATDPILLPPIDAGFSQLNDDQVKEVWQRVAEDYRAFNINVTTDVALYNAAPVGSRMRCIITTNDAAAPDAGGVAFTGSWADAAAVDYSNNVPCWVFSSALLYDAKLVAEAVSHEIGHTLGLSHDGLKDAGGSTVVEYYEGHGSGPTGWAPIMGLGYYRSLSQWSRGEYIAGAMVVNSIEYVDGAMVVNSIDYAAGELVANNTEDDLAIIASNGNRTGYVTDNASGALAEAANLPLVGATAAEITGVLEQTGDVDTYQVVVGAGSVHFTVGPALADAMVDGLGDVDAQLELYDSAGTLLTTSNPQGAITADLVWSVPAGVYRLRVRGTGEGDVSGTGYSNYASIGRYRLAGTFTAPVPQAPVIGGPLEWRPATGVPASYQVQAVGAPLAYYATGLPYPLKMDSATGVISGTPATPGEYTVTLTAVNQSGSTSRALSLVVLSSEWGAAVGAPELAWTSGGDLPWVLDDVLFFDLRSSIHSGPVQGSQQSWVETTVTGPGDLSFRWKVSSEENLEHPDQPYDRLEFLVDGNRVDFISGEVDWAPKTYAVPSGTHTLRWTYQKDPFASVGQDTGWLDTVVYARAEAPVITAPASGVVAVGDGYSFKIVASNTPNAYTAGALPPGLVFDAGTGVLSGVPTTAGSYTVNLGATNGYGTGNATLMLTVCSRFAAWAGEYGLIADPGLAGADSDGDGVPNLVEYAFETDPTVANPTAAPVVTTKAGGVEDPHLEIEFIRPATRADLAYTVEVSSDLLSGWTAGHAYGPGVDNTGVTSTQEIECVPLGDGRERIRVRDLLPPGAPRRFIRLKITSP